MPRPLRIDEPGRWHHLTNRGVARRTIFETRREIRYFLSRLAYVVRRTLIEIHAFCVLPNHFHLLVRSRAGEVSRALQWAQDLSARRFNLLRNRKGPVFEGRYHSSHVDSTSYLVNVIRYIEENPVHAGLVTRPGLYPFASAAYHRQGKFPRWLSTHIVWELAGMFAGGARSAWERYLRFLDRGDPVTRRRMVEACVRGHAAPPPSFENLIRSSSPKLLEWLCERSRAADGRGASCGVIASSPETVLRSLGVTDPAELSLRTPESAATTALAAGLLRTIAGLTTSEIAARMAVSRPTVQRWLRRHVDWLKTNRQYTDRAETTVRECLEVDQPDLKMLPELSMLSIRV